MAVAFLDPASNRAYELMIDHGIDYVVVPQWFNHPDSLSAQLRWRDPQRLPQLSKFSDAKYLDLVAVFDGAQVWKLKE